jgi:hypothetical protein
VFWIAFDRERQPVFGLAISGRGQQCQDLFRIADHTEIDVASGPSTFESQLQRDAAFQSHVITELGDETDEYALEQKQLSKAIHVGSAFSRLVAEAFFEGRLEGLRRGVGSRHSRISGPVQHQFLSLIDRPVPAGSLAAWLAR